MKAQNCPICNEEIAVSERRLVHHSEVPRCIFSKRSIQLKLWNRIRIAPSNGSTGYWYRKNSRGKDTETTDWEPWMNPRYPDEKKEQE